MNTLWKITPWLGRLVLLAATLLFAMIAAKGIFDPVRTASASGITFNSTQGITILRVGFGAFPLVFAALFLFCVTAASRTGAGLGMVASVAAITLLVRIFGISVDGTLAQNMMLLRAETGMLVLASLALGLETIRKRQREPRPSQLGQMVS